MNNKAYVSCKNLTLGCHYTTFLFFRIHPRRGYLIIISEMGSCSVKLCRGRIYLFSCSRPSSSWARIREEISGTPFRFVPVFEMVGCAGTGEVVIFVADKAKDLD